MKRRQRSSRRGPASALALVELPVGRQPIQTLRAGFTLVELLVVIAIIGTLVSLLLPAVQSAREASRGASCRVHLAELQKAITMYEDNNKHYPGYVEDVTTPVSSVEMSWVGAILPYIEQQALYEAMIGQGGVASKSLEIMICPSSPPNTEGGPASSYLANAGWIQNERPHGTDDCKPVENIANGVFFDRTRGGEDIRDLTPMCDSQQLDPVYRVTAATVQAKGDGMTNTLMLSEGLSALYWDYVGASSPNKKWDFGFTWEQPYDIQQARGSRDWGSKEESPAWRVVNGLRENISGSTIGSKPPNSGFASSNHPSGVNVAFVGGQVQVINESVHAMVFAQLMTSNRKKSDLRDLSQNYERDGSQPGADEY